MSPIYANLKLGYYHDYTKIYRNEKTHIIKLHPTETNHNYIYKKNFIQESNVKYYINLCN